MTVEKAPVNWNEALLALEKVEQQLWAEVSREGELKTENCIFLSGYYVKFIGVKNYKPRITITAEIDLPETKNTNADVVNKHITSAVGLINSDELSLNLAIIPHYPMMSSLEKDRVFGKTPDMPNSITYEIKPDYSNYVKNY